MVHLGKMLGNKYMDELKYKPTENERIYITLARKDNNERRKLAMLNRIQKLSENISALESEIERDEIVLVEKKEEVDAFIAMKEQAKIVEKVEVKNILETPEETFEPEPTLEEHIEDNE